MPQNQKNQSEFILSREFIYEHFQYRQGIIDEEIIRFIAP